MCCFVTLVRWRSSSVGSDDDYLCPSDESTFSPHKTSCRTLKFSADGSGMCSKGGAVEVGNIHTANHSSRCCCTPRLSLSLSGCYGNVGFDHCPPLCPSIHPPRPLFIHLSTLPCIHPSTTNPFFHSSVCLSFQIFIYPYINPSIIPSTLHPSTFLSIHWPRAITTQCWYTHYHNHVPFVPSPVLGVKGR